MNPEWLSNQYLVQKKLVRQIADECKVHPDIIRFYMDQYNIYRPTPKCVHGMVICQKCQSNSISP